MVKHGEPASRRTAQAGSRADDVADMDATMNDLPFTREQWFKLPLELRDRWWSETDYSKKPAGEKLQQAVLDAVKDAALSANKG